MQGCEGAPEAWLDIEPEFSACLDGIRVDDELLVLTWLHRASRSVLQTHPRDNPESPLLGVFATRSPERPNPIGLHPVTVLEVNGNQLRVRPLEAIDGTPIIDLKPAL
jgi:tRNA-Thr(GGU) m(6)t(6)A37 methyltransferase TsaA